MKFVQIYQEGLLRSVIIGTGCGSYKETVL